MLALASAALSSVQAPLSALAARNLTAVDFLGFTRFALLMSVPVLIMWPGKRRDFAAILLDIRHWPKLAVVFCVGVIGLTLYDIGLSSAHPIITAARLSRGDDPGCDSAEATTWFAVATTIRRLISPFS